MQTPYYVIHKEKLDSLMGSLNGAIRSHWPNSLVGYSFKTNSLPWIIHYMKHAGYYAEVVSEDEYEMAVKEGFGNRIIYNGPIKSKESFLNAIKKGCVVNIDSKRELRWLIEAGIAAKIGVRVNFDLERYCPGETQCGIEGGRFGFCYENGELEALLRETADTKIKIVGLHLHCSSKTRSVGIYESIARICCEVKEKYNLRLNYIDIGGGFFGGVPGKPDFNMYFEHIVEILDKHFDTTKTQLIVEPGMSLIGAPIDYVTSVVDVKDTTCNRFVVTDGSRINVDPLMKKSSYCYYIDYCDNNRKNHKKQVVCGFTCMENDRLLTIIDEPEMKENDQIIYEKVGAYTMCLTPLFIELFPDVYLEENGNLENIRERWNVDKIL